ncbi:hypothetical protein IEU95_05780 [Hoyosella rhizosphaerae]|uniref:Uncharacterized protein n=1 Tax=Hoyosella rhizosphaerae TaxID=1755582 RepID=A0A916U4C2_9ACTN|nr:hypothetical protein [Hoyosella rhizosphaerae]MBN4926331.1 hypothetical protein [Hoyosella rhizosphaerae]GGC60181.1 hypothetical protein GCM10011410_10830 [Hoyosella rhizosphaerae]
MVLKVIGAVVVIWIGLMIVGSLFGALVNTISTLLTLTLIGAAAYFIYKAVSGGKNSTNSTNPDQYRF